MKQSIFKFLFLITFGILLSLDSSSFAQDLNQTDKGGFYFYWGYNRSTYTKSDLHLVGEGYDFTMKKMTASDNPEKLGMDYLNIKKITIPQFNLRLGYFFKDKWALTLGYDHMKYLMDHPQQFALDGYVEPGVSELWSGNYDNQLVTSDYDHIHYENSDGLNYIRVELARYFDLLAVGQNNWFRVRAQAAVAAGAILSYNDLNFNGQFDRRTISVSGYGISLHPGVRLEFFNHIFLQTNFSAGFMHQTKVRTRPEHKGSYGKQRFGYIASDLVLGYTWRFNK
ncbi:MAG TPA: hypothetical protein VKY37_07465 [Brumimicrobium sp.]|nr:hypothetical protein [Brumimicrobium sp.]